MDNTPHPPRCEIQGVIFYFVIYIIGVHTNRNTDVVYDQKPNKNRVENDFPTRSFS